MILTRDKEHPSPYQEAGADLQGETPTPQSTLWAGDGTGQNLLIVAEIAKSMGGFVGVLVMQGNWRTEQK